MRKAIASEEEVATARWMWRPSINRLHIPSATPAHVLYRLQREEKPGATSLHILTAGQRAAGVNGQVTKQYENWVTFDREDIRWLPHSGNNDIELDAVSRKIPRLGGTFSAVAAGAIRLTDTSGQEKRIVTDDTSFAKSNVIYLVLSVSNSQDW